MPPPGSQMDALAQRVLPILDEFGLGAFVMFGYLTDADGKVQRVCIANTGKNPAFEDGLRPALQFAHMWGAPPAQFAPPPPAAPPQFQPPESTTDDVPPEEHR